MKVRATRLVGGGTGLGLLTKSIELDFLSGSLDPRITFTRASSATYFDSAGVLQTAANDVARFDYNPSTLAARGLLIEEQRTNSIRNNTMQGTVDGTPGTMPTNWSASLAGGLSRQIVGTGQVNGITYVDIRVFGTTTNTNLALNVAFEPLTGVASASGQAWAESMYLALVAGSSSGIANTRLYLSSTDGVSELAYFNLGGVTLTSTLARFSGTASPATAGMTAVRPLLWVQHNGIGTAVDFTLRIGLPQLEQGAFETSVIPTSTTALTRSADAAAITGTNFTNWFNQAQGTFFVEYQGVNNVAGATRRAFEVGVSGSTDNRYVIGYSSTTQTRSLVATGGVTQADIYVNATQGNIIKTATAYAVNDISVATNGALGTPDTAATLPTVSQLWFGTAEGSASNTILNGYIRKFVFYPTRLPDGTLQALTS